MPAEASSPLLKIHSLRYERDIDFWRYRDLVTPYWRLYWNETPGAYLEIQGRRHPMGPDRVFLLPGYLRFSTGQDAPFHQVYIHFTPREWNTRLPPRLHALSVTPSLEEEFRRFLALPNTSQCRQWRDLLGLAILTECLCQLPRELFLLPAQMDPRIQATCDFLRSHGRERVENETLAQMAHLSRNSFVRLFRKETGETPQTLSRRWRIEEACDLLHFSQLSLEEIAERTGFADRYHFSRVFRKLLGNSPACFRKSSRSPQG
ncbi:MAG: helix-turn-helix domain-containing protein [Oligosphaeraceae bacterium]